MIAPVPGGPLLHNLAATLLRHGNTAAVLTPPGIATIAKYQGLCPGELTRELVRQEQLNGKGFEEGCEK